MLKAQNNIFFLFILILKQQGTLAFKLKQHKIVPHEGKDNEYEKSRKPKTTDI